MAGHEFPFSDLQNTSSPPKDLFMNQCLLSALTLLVIALPQTAPAFCGFYVAKADSKLFNRASQVVLARDGNRTVLTMANDYEGEPKDFAIVIPVPTVIKKEAVQVVDKAAMDHIDAYSAPRLVEYFDDDPCRPAMPMDAAAMPRRPGFAKHDDGEKALGVKIEEKFS